MPKTDAHSAEPMALTSMRLPKTLHQALIQKSRDLDLSLAKTVGYLFDQNQKQTLTTPGPDYGLLTYVLIQETIHNFVENSQGLIDQARQKAELLHSAISGDPLSQDSINP